MDSQVLFMVTAENGDELESELERWKGAFDIYFLAVLQNKLAPMNG